MMDHTKEAARRHFNIRMLFLWGALLLCLSFYEAINPPEVAEPSMSPADE